MQYAKEKKSSPQDTEQEISQSKKERKKKEKKERKGRKEKERTKGRDEKEEKGQRWDYRFFWFGTCFRMSSKLMVGLKRLMGRAGGSIGATPAGKGSASSPGLIDIRWSARLRAAGELARGMAGGGVRPTCVGASSGVGCCDPE